jgi:hypothetical protein
VHVNPRHVSFNAHRCKARLLILLSSMQMFLCQTIGTVLGCVVNYYTLNEVIDSKRPFLDGTMVDPTGQVMVLRK